MKEYHVADSLSSSGYPDTAVGITGNGRNPYAYTVVPPIGRLLDAIRAHCGVGGTIRPRNRTLADWANYASAGHIAPLLDQLACDGRILYDRSTGLITLLFDPARDQLIPDGINADDSEESALIPSLDRFLAQQEAEFQSDPAWDQNAQCMEDSCLTTTGDSESVAVKTQIPCGGESIPPPDHPILLLLAELGLKPGRGVFERGMAAHTWMPQQIRDRYEYDQERIKNSNGTKHIGIFWTAFLHGELAPSRPDPAAPLDPQSYANRDGFALGSVRHRRRSSRSAIGQCGCVATGRPTITRPRSVTADFCKADWPMAIATK